jgi:hypothetical protein
MGPVLAQAQSAWAVQVCVGVWGEGTGVWVYFVGRGSYSCLNHGLTWYQWAIVLKALPEVYSTRLVVLVMMR